MAGRFVSLVLIGLQDPEVPSGAKLIAAALADFANAAHKGLAWPSVAALARLSSMSERQARGHLCTLEQRGWIEAQPGKRGRAATTHYQLNLLRMQSMLSEQQKAEVYRRLSAAKARAKSGSALPGIGTGKAEVQRKKAEVQRTKGGSPAHENRKPTSAELEVTGITSTGSEPARARDSNVTALLREGQHRLTKTLTSEPEPRAPLLTREEQAAVGRMTLDEAKAFRARKGQS